MVALIKMTCCRDVSVFGYRRLSVAVTHLDLLVPLQNLPQLKQQKVSINASFVHLIDNDVGHAFEVCISSARQSPKDHSRGAESNLGHSGIGSRLASNHISDGLSGLVEILHSFFRHPSSNTDRSHSSRLCDDDIGRGATALADFVIENVTGRLRRLSRTSLSNNDHNAILFERVDDVLPG